MAITVAGNNNLTLPVMVVGVTRIDLDIKNALTGYRAGGTTAFSLVIGQNTDTPDENPIDALPIGLSLSSTGILSGTPKYVSTARTVSIRITESKTDEQDINTYIPLYCGEVLAEDDYPTNPSDIEGVKLLDVRCSTKPIFEAAVNASVFRRKLIYGYYTPNPYITDIVGGSNDLLFIPVPKPKSFIGSKYVKIISQINMTEALAITNGQTSGSVPPTNSLLNNPNWITIGEAVFVKEDMAMGGYEIYDRSVHNFVGSVKLNDETLINGFRSNPIEDINNPNIEAWKYNPNGTTWGGTGIIDRLYRAVSSWIDIQFQLGRVPVDKAGALLGQCFSVIVTQGIIYALNKDKSASEQEKAMATTELCQKQAVGFEDATITKLLGVASQGNNLIATSDNPAQALSASPLWTKKAGLEAYFNACAAFMCLPAPGGVAYAENNVVTKEEYEEGNPDNPLASTKENVVSQFRELSAGTAPKWYKRDPNGDDRPTTYKPVSTSGTGADYTITPTGKYPEDGG